jgi:hypothetical protein
LLACILLELVGKPESITDSSDGCHRTVLKNQETNVFHSFHPFRCSLTRGAKRSAEVVRLFSQQANHSSCEINASKFPGRTWLVFAGVLA